MRCVQLSRTLFTAVAILVTLNSVRAQPSQVPYHEGIPIEQLRI